MKQNLLIDGNEIPVNIYIERRNGVRASIVKSGVNIRIPLYFSNTDRAQHIEKLKQWAIKRIRESEALQKKFYTKSYSNGQMIKVQDHVFELNIIPKDRKTYSGKLGRDKIFIYAPLDATEQEMSEVFPRLISNLMAKCFQQRLANRVHAINEKYYGKTVKRIALKYTRSIWGSCSGNGNITLSSRLLLAPQDVMDYVIVHELAHRVHANHSAAFWNEVRRVMPNYKEKERWLKEHGHHCDF